MNSMRYIARAAHLIPRITMCRRLLLVTACSAASMSDGAAGLNAASRGLASHMATGCGNSVRRLTIVVAPIILGTRGLRLRAASLEKPAVACTFVAFVATVRVVALCCHRTRALRNTTPGPREVASFRLQLSTPTRMAARHAAERRRQSDDGSTAFCAHRTAACSRRGLVEVTSHRITCTYMCMYDSIYVHMITYSLYIYSVQYECDVSTSLHPSRRPFGAAGLVGVSRRPGETSAPRLAQAWAITTHARPRDGRNDQFVCAPVPCSVHCACEGAEGIDVWRQRKSRSSSPVPTCCLRT